MQQLFFYPANTSTQVHSEDHWMCWCGGKKPNLPCCVDLGQSFHLHLGGSPPEWTFRSRHHSVLVPYFNTITDTQWKLKWRTWLCLRINFWPSPQHLKQFQHQNPFINLNCLLYHDFKIFSSICFVIFLQQCFYSAVKCSVRQCSGSIITACAAWFWLWIIFAAVCNLSLLRSFEMVAMISVAL